jgi:O-antigen ligase
VALPVLFAVWLVTVVRPKTPLKILGAFAGLLLVCCLLYVFVGSVHGRVDSALADLQLYFNGGTKDTSIGLRISMWRASWHLLLARPFTGYGEGALPALESIPAIAPYYTPSLQSFISNSGAHSELMRNAIRSGIFGLISTALLFAVPAVIFFRACRAAERRVRLAAAYGLCYIAAVFFFGLNTDVFSLKYLATFYGLMIAQTTSQVVWASRREVASPQR